MSQLSWSPGSSNARSFCGSPQGCAPCGGTRCLADCAPSARTYARTHTDAHMHTHAHLSISHANTTDCKHECRCTRSRHAVRRRRGSEHALKVLEHFWSRKAGRQLVNRVLVENTVVGHTAGDNATTAATENKARTRATLTTTRRAQCTRTHVHEHEHTAHIMLPVRATGAAQAVERRGWYTGETHSSVRRVVLKSTFSARVRLRTSTP